FVLTSIDVLGDDKKGPQDKLPEFTYQTLEGKKFSSEDLKASKIMLVYFNPLCDICQRETQMILDNIKYFEKIQIVFISPAEIVDVEKFSNKFKLDQFKEITVLHDKNDLFYKQFDAIGYPSVYLYNEKKELLTYFEAEIGLEDIKGGFEPKVSTAKQTPAKVGIW
ncbi:MAG TPA: redoxin domain-containing protein, partial [Cytophagaceae bacterium]